MEQTICETGGFGSEAIVMSMDGVVPYALAMTHENGHGKGVDLALFI